MARRDRFTGVTPIEQRNYLRLLDRAVMTVNSTGHHDPDYILARLKQHRVRGYSQEHIAQILKAQMELPEPPPMRLPPDLQRDLDRLGRALGGATKA